MPSPPPKPTAYSTPPTTSDTSFRRTWDRTEYAAKAAAREDTRKRESAARQEARLLGRKYHPPPPTSTSTSTSHAPPSPHDTDTSARAHRLDVSQLIGKTTLVPLGAATGKRGKGAGFYCEACDLTFKDNVQFVDHLNSRQHLVATGQSGEVRRAGVEEVRERLAWLGRRRREEEEERGREGLGLRERLEGRRGEMEREREERRERRREKRRMGKGGGGGGGMEGEQEVGVRGGIIC